MSINTYFSWARFTRLFKQDLLINKSKYLLTLLGMSVISYLLMYWFLNSNKGIMSNLQNYVGNNYIICFLFYMVAVGVVIGTSFPDLTDKIKTSTYLLTPASVLEKVLLQFIIRIGLFIPVALAIFWTAIRLAKASLVSDPDKNIDVSKIPYFDFRMLVSNANNNELIDQELIYLLIFALFAYGLYLFAGTTIFKRFALIKTVIISGLLFGSCVLFMMFLSTIFYPEKEGFNMSLRAFPITKDINSVNLFVLVLAVFSWIVFLFLSYFKLKEKEV